MQKLSYRSRCIVWPLLSLLWLIGEAGLFSQEIHISPGKTVYTINPATGDDRNLPGQTWQTFRPLQSFRLAPGDQVIIHPGIEPETLRLLGEGTEMQPVVVRFLAGTHTVGSGAVLRVPMFPSNSNDTDEPRPTAIWLDHVKNLRLEGADGPERPLVLYAGRYVQIYNDHTENVVIDKLVFDQKRTSASEFRALEVNGAKATIQVAEGSDYAIENGEFLWKGDWNADHWALEADLKTKRLVRSKTPPGWSGTGQSLAKATDLGNRRVALEYPNADTGLTEGHQYGLLGLKRDRVSIFNDFCRNVAIRDCHIEGTSGMAILSQFTQDVTLQRVEVAPPKETIRQVAAVIDIFHFSNCRGELRIEDCNLSGMQDDAMNVHGTYLAVTAGPSANQLLLTYRHAETYGFPPYATGDELAVIDPQELCERIDNPRQKVLAVEKKTPRDWLVTFGDIAPAFVAGDVVDNMTWQPNVTALRNHISMDAVRGFLLTSRGRMQIEDNTFEGCAMPGILVEGDAGEWFESGAVKDLTISGNHFVDCGIKIDPHRLLKVPGQPIHAHIRILGNHFENGSIEAKSTRALTITGNRSSGTSLKIDADVSCVDLIEKDNAKSE